MMRKTDIGLALIGSSLLGKILLLTSILTPAILSFRGAGLFLQIVPIFTYPGLIVLFVDFRSDLVEIGPFTKKLRQVFLLAIIIAIVEFLINIPRLGLGNTSSIGTSPISILLGIVGLVIIGKMSSQARDDRRLRLLMAVYFIFPASYLIYSVLMIEFFFSALAIISGPSIIISFGLILFPLMVMDIFNIYLGLQLRDYEIVEISDEQELLYSQHNEETQQELVDQ